MAETDAVGMTAREAELQAALAALLAVVEDTTRQLEEEAPGLAECGYWHREQKAAYERAKELSGNWRDVGEGPWDTALAAEHFAKAEVAWPWRVMRDGEVFRVWVHESV